MALTRGDPSFLPNQRPDQQIEGLNPGVHAHGLNTNRSGHAVRDFNAREEEERSHHIVCRAISKDSRHLGDEPGNDSGLRGGEHLFAPSIRFLRSPAA